MFIVCWFYNEPIKKYAVAVSYPCSIWVFPFMMAQYTFLILFFLAVIYANADVPFMQYSNMYVLLRTGRKRWCLIQISVLFCRAVIVVGLTSVTSILTLLPEIEFTKDWGKLLRTIGIGKVLDEVYLNYSILYEAIAKWSAFESFMLTFSITVLVVFFVYILMFLISLYLKRVAAVASVSFLTFSMFFVLNTHPKIRYLVAKVMPILWPEIARTYTPDYGYYWLPSPYYMFSVLIVCILAMIIVVMRRVKYIEFEWNQEDGKGGIF